MILSPPPIRSNVSEQDGTAQRDWLKWFQAIVTVLNSQVPGPYANDAAAKAGGVNIGWLYYDAAGTPHVRIV